MTNSRTSKSIKNAKVALIFYFAQLVLGFFSRKAFFDYLGSEFLGLNTTASNLLGFLNLAELGVSAAICYFLYQPLYEKDYDKLNKLVTIQGWIYRKVAYIIIGASLVLMSFFPMIFSKTSLPLWYAYCMFGVLLFSSILGYFYNYKQIVLYADQKNYKIQQYVQGTGILKMILQIIAVSYLPNPFWGWLVLEAISAVVTTIILNFILKKEYPWLKTSTKEGKAYIKEYPEVLKKTGQVFFHRIGAVILGQSSPLIIYGFTSLTTVALFGNYMLIINKIGFLLTSIFSSIGAAIGDLVATKNQQRIIKVFWELYDSRLCISVVVLICLFHLTNPFITIWLGKDFCLSKTFLLLYIMLSSISMTRATVDSYISAHGLYKDIWAPMTEAVINVSMSVLLGTYFGLNGIIAGILISQVVIISIWKPYFLFKAGLKISAKKYFIPVIHRYIIVSVLFVAFHFLFLFLDIERIESVKDFILNAVVVCISSLIVVGIIFYVMFPGTRDFIERILLSLRAK